MTDKRDDEADKRDAALSRVARAEDNHYDAIYEHTRRWVAKQRRGKTFTVGEACSEAVRLYKPREDRVTGPVMRNLARAGVIEALGWTNTGSHKSPQRIWKKL